MSATERLTWIPMAPAPTEMLAASLDAYTFEISRMADERVPVIVQDPS